MVEKFLERGSFVIMPPFIRQKRQLNPAERREQLVVARDRVHVERAFERLRRFEVMKFVKHYQYKHFNKLVIILAYTVNQFGPLIRDENCSYKEQVEKEDDITEDYIDDLLRNYDDAFPNADDGDDDEYC